MYNYKADTIASCGCWNYGYRFNAHEEAWLVRTRVVVKRTGAPDKYSRYMATMGDYDLDCKVGYGETAEQAVEDLFAAMDE